jgi:hypothetical protein
MDDKPARDRDQGFEAAGGDPPGSGAGGQAGREQRLATMRAAVERGLDDVRAGRVADLDAALDRIERMLDEMDEAKRG